MKKHQNRIEIVGAYYIRIVIGRSVFESRDFYETKSSALRVAKRIASVVCPAKSVNKLPIYDYDGLIPGIGNERAKYEIVH